MTLSHSPVRTRQRGAVLLLSLCLWLGMATGPHAEAADPSVSIENLLSAPFPYGLTAAPKGEPELLVIPNEVHDFILHRSWRRVFDATHEFIDRYLQPGT